MTSINKLLMRSGTTIAIALILMAVPALFLTTSFKNYARATSDSMMDDGSKMMDKNGAMMVDKPKHMAFKGQISNVQLNGDREPDWIQSGIWVLRISYNEGSDQPTLGFIARIMMVKPDGSSLHMHAISQLAVSDYSTEGNTHSIKGTATVTVPSGSATGVPIVIKVMNDSVMAINIGPDGVDGHFGSDPIYGIAFSGSTARMGMGQMMEEPAKLTKTNVPVTIPLTQGFVDGNEVFYISTEASDKDLADHLTNITGSRVAYAPALARTPPSAFANIYAFSNGVEGEGPLGFQPNVADSQPGDPEYSPLWRIILVEWQDGVTPRTLVSEDEIVAAQSLGEVKITPTQMIVNCPFVQWEGGSLQVRTDATLTDDTAYGGGQVLEIDLESMEVTFVAHRGFAPDGSTIYYIATDASVKEVADALGVLHVNKTGSTLLTGAASDLWVFTNGIQGTGPMGFQASIASSNVGDVNYSPMWRITATTWASADQARFLTTAAEISGAAQAGLLATEIAGAVVNCPFVEIN
ncbi:MAG TPA: hypothetical protein VGQ03_03695 [Nitrososphaera sp.]|jgi:hypothetical protein|nr:hypothetical protein [Nitrososphaera sp.]